MVVKVLARDESSVSVLDRGHGVDDQEVTRLCRWVARHFHDARPRARVGDFRLSRVHRATDGGTFTFVVDESV